MDKKSLSERDICTKFITPAIVKAGWDRDTQIMEEVSFTHGKIIVRGKLVSRGKQKRADYILYYKNNIPIAIIEAKDNKHSVGAGIQQGIDYAEILDIPFVFSSNGDAFLFHDRTIDLGKKEIELPLNKFPSPQEKLKNVQTKNKVAEQELTHNVEQEPTYNVEEDTTDIKAGVIWNGSCSILDNREQAIGFQKALKAFNVTDSRICRITIEDSYDYEAIDEE